MSSNEEIDAAQFILRADVFQMWDPPSSHGGMGEAGSFGIVRLAASTSDLGNS